MDHPLKFCLQFSSKNADQIRVAQILKLMGRRKSSFIAKAILFYIRKNPAFLHEQFGNEIPTKQEAPTDASIISQKAKNVNDGLHDTKDLISHTAHSDLLLNKESPKEASQYPQENSFENKNSDISEPSSAEDSELAGLLDGLKFF